MQPESVQTYCSFAEIGAAHRRLVGSKIGGSVRSSCHCNRWQPKLPCAENIARSITDDNGTRFRMDSSLHPRQRFSDNLASIQCTTTEEACAEKWRHLCDSEFVSAAASLIASEHSKDCPHRLRSLEKVHHRR